MFEKYSPIKTFWVRNQKHNSWWNNNLRDLRRKARQAERSKKLSRSEKKRVANTYKVALASAKKKDNKEKFELSKHNPKLLFKTFNSLTESDNTIIPGHINRKELANKFAHYYIDKIELIRENIKMKQRKNDLNKTHFQRKQFA